MSLETFSKTVHNLHKYNMQKGLRGKKLSSSGDEVKRNYRFPRKPVSHLKKN